MRSSRALKRRCAPLPGGGGCGEFGRPERLAQPCNLAGGPLTKAPRETGFRSTPVATTIRGIGGQIDYDWRPKGLVAQVKLPLASLKS